MGSSAASLSHAPSPRALSLPAQFLCPLCFTGGPVARQVLWAHCGLEMKERRKTRKKGDTWVRGEEGEDFREKMIEDLRDRGQIEVGRMFQVGGEKRAR